MELTEKQVEKYLKEQVERHGGLCIKMSPIFFAGIPDRLVVMPGPIIAFVEVKRPRASARPLQERLLAKLSALGVQAEQVQSYRDVDRFILSLRKTPQSRSLLSGKMTLDDVQDVINREQVCPCCGERALIVSAFERIADGLIGTEYCTEQTCRGCGFRRVDTRKPWWECNEIPSKDV